MFLLDGTEIIESKNIIIATGARANELAGFEADGNLVWSYKEAMTPKQLPKSLIVVGGGVIGVEFASFYSTMGTEVTIIEHQDRILIHEDKEIVSLATKELTRSGIKIINNSKLEKILNRLSYFLKRKMLIENNIFLMLNNYDYLNRNIIFYNNSIKYKTIYKKIKMLINLKGKKCVEFLESLLRQTPNCHQKN